MNEKDAAFLELLQPQQGRLLRLAWSILGNEADAGDALQEAVVAAYRNFHQLKGGAAAFPAWMRRIVINQCTNILRRRQRLVPVERPEDLTPEPFEWSEGAWGNADLWEAVNSLDDRYRPVVILRFVNDLPLEEIAQALDIPLGTVKSRLHAAMKKLRAELETVAAQEQAL